MSLVLKPKRGKASTLTRINPILENGEICLEFPDTGVGTGLGRIKIGDGEKDWNHLPYFVSHLNGDPIMETEKGAPNGVVPLNGVAKIDSQYLPSYVDDVLEFDSFRDFPVTGEPGKIYIDTSTTENNAYRWSGSQYVNIGRSVRYTIESEGTTLSLIASDSTKIDITHFGGVEIRRNDPTGDELYPGKLWIKI